MSRSRALLPGRHLYAEFPQNVHSGCRQRGTHPFLRTGKVFPHQLERSAGTPGRRKAISKPVKSGSKVSTGAINGFTKCAIEAAFTEDLPAIDYADLSDSVPLSCMPCFEPGVLNNMEPAIMRFDGMSHPLPLYERTSRSPSTPDRFRCGVRAGMAIEGRDKAALPGAALTLEHRAQAHPSDVIRPDRLAERVDHAQLHIGQVFPEADRFSRRPENQDVIDLCAIGLHKESADFMRRNDDLSGLFFDQAIERNNRTTFTHLVPSRRQSGKS
ncbi:hypothetical protein BG846_05690 [Streptomyces fradiae ATCC 10745 = DSM 40063]|uniref:Uncharacterized protein n=1 Tax=Streptomyces fradiae ATCC 10745 = DSM 40063 TaxID=1319510 RepID=A0A1Y2NMY2_STRFR|nr:hypothetical protein BG846_05690 [Streptomyces fradiae ATCC 10745 = DSM 40063]